MFDDYTWITIVPLSLIRDALKYPFFSDLEQIGVGVCFLHCVVNVFITLEEKRKILLPIS